MNRALRRGMNKKHGLHGSKNRRGGGYSAQGALLPINQTPGGDWSNKTGLGQYAVTNPYSDCYWTERPGELYNKPDLALAQVRMAGGGCGCMRGGACGCMRGGACGAPSFTGMPVAVKGGRRTLRKRGGGNYGFAVDPSQSVGGNGPNVGAFNVPVPCDGRMGTQHALNPPQGGPDPRAPTDLYSVSPAGSTASVRGAEEGLLNPAFMKGGRRRTLRRRRQRAGAYGTPNAYPEECYRAPGSSLPVYNASSAGFTFSPSTEKGVFLPDGVAAYNEVWPTAARVGGGRRNKSKKQRKSRKSAKKNKRSNRSRKH